MIKKVFPYFRYLIFPITLGILTISNIQGLLFLLCILLAAIFNAVMDSIENEHIFSTIFSKLNPSFWSKRESWNKSYTIMEYDVDAWHLSKSANIICWISAILLYRPLINPIMDLLLMGYFLNTTFSAFYNEVFKLRTKN